MVTSHDSSGEAAGTRALWREAGPPTSPRPFWFGPEKCYTPATMVARQRLEGGLRLRRSRRTDLVRVRALLPVADRERDRFDRRTLAGLAQDVYVAEAPGGTIVGIVAIGYLRSLRDRRWDAVLDTACTAAGEGPLLDALLDLAEERARRRGCHRVRAWPAHDDRSLRRALAARGWQGDEMLVGALAPPS
jgi:hypothetical protein